MPLVVVDCHAAQPFLNQEPNPVIAEIHFAT
jgi:hypothetical protein